MDKDRTAAVLGLRLAADTVMSLTDVDAVYQDWGTPRQRPLRTLTLEQAEALLAAGGAIQAAAAGAFALVRPPGQHATSHPAMGVCPFNKGAGATPAAQAEVGLARGAIGTTLSRARKRLVDAHAAMEGSVVAVSE